MKSNELMLKDLVRYKETFYRVYDLRTKRSEMHQIGLYDSTYGGVYPKEEEIDPIPLTPEILEANGWKLNYWWERANCPFLLVSYAEGSWADGKFGVMFDQYAEDPVFLIGSVHEFQHLLRLCGLTEEGDNFKVD